MAASLMDPDEFLINCLNKYGLIGWTKPEYDNPTGQEDFLRQTVTLAEEFLTLLIYIFEERYVPGVGDVTKKDAVKREIIHQLCISAMPHSKLAKALPEDPNHETGLEEVVEEVATFKKPSGGVGNGKYELKEQYFADYCPFFYHYTKAEQSKDQALPPPVLPKFRPQFSPILRLFYSDVMMQILNTILSRTSAARSRSWSEAQFERVLYIIGLALHEQIAAIKNGDKSFLFLHRAVAENGMLSQLEQLVHSPNVSQEPIKDLLAWVLRKFGEALQLSDEPSSNEQLENLAKCADLRTQSERKKKAAIAAKRRAKVMAQMSKMQKDFIAENAELFENTRTDMGASAGEMDFTEPLPDSVALGPAQSLTKVTGPITVTCILCQEEETASHTGRAMVLAAYVQMSTVLSQNRSKHLANGEKYDPLLMSADLFNGTHTSSCGHYMHHECWQRFFQNIVNKERRRPMRFRHSFSYDIDKMEYLCPLCEGLSNTVIPIIPHLTTLGPEGEGKEVTLQFDDWLDGIHKTAVNSVQNKEIQGDFFLTLQPCPISTITRMMAESVARNFQLLWDYVSDDASGRFSEGMREMMQKFAKDVYVFGLGVKPDDENPQQYLASEGQGIFGSLTERQSSLLGSLVRFAAVVSQVMPADVIREHCVRLLSLLIPEKVECLVYDTECLLDVDMFHFLVALTMTLPSLHTLGSCGQPVSNLTLASIPSGGLNDQHALTLVYIVHLSMEVEADPEGKALLDVYKSLRSDAGLDTTELPSPWQLMTHVKEASLSFLRCAALLYHHLTGVVTPISLHDKTSDEFVHLCNYLALPNIISPLFKGQHTAALVKSWCCSRTVRERLSASSTPLMRYPRTIKGLITLPKDYSELINEVSSFTCPKSETDDSRAPTRCLVCGTMLCSQSYCCQEELDGTGTVVGAATQVRDCQILLLSGRTKGCFLPAPYLDSYGETDQGLRRGNPLTLSQEQYDNIQKIWFQHAIPQTIARNLNQESTGFLTIEWNNL
ncbi:hypothetical protein BaRGS_00003182 [Batillaria attramentaria]|uniref:E3 ubiquitin-protein ligase n=1 Tax=Batillaria attramentaria TaxID=370345 RepID=A0ABD0M2K9_9CAEN